MKPTAITAVLATLFVLALGCQHSAAAERPNIVLVMGDDHGYGDCGFTGHPFVQTPNLDAMAKEGVVFNRFYASCPVCSPTRAAVMTGRHAFRVNVPNHGHYLRPREVTIAEAFRDAGYVTGHFGKWHIGSVQPDSRTSPGGQGFDEWMSGLNFFDNDPYLSHNGEYVKHKGAGSVIATDATVNFLTKHACNEKPMLAVLWLPSPHDPFGEIPANIDGAATLYDNEKTKKAGYYREITLLDQQIGLLRDTLRVLKIADNTILFYCSDNGGLVDATAGGRGRKGSIYEGGLRVPAVLEWPGKFGAAKVDAVASTTDLLPTMASLAGIDFKPPHPLDGIDFSPVLVGKKFERPPIGFWHGFQNGESTWSDRIIKSLKTANETDQPNPHPARILKNVDDYPAFEKDTHRGHAAWLDWPWKLHRIKKGETVSLELYDLVADPEETNDLSADQPDRVGQMDVALKAWQNSVLSSWEGNDYENLKRHLFILSGQSNMEGMNAAPFVAELKKIMPDTDIQFVKVAKGGQPIRKWVANYQQLAKNAGIEKDFSNVKPVYYDAILKAVAGTPGDKKGFDSVSFLWMQGERDAKENLAPAYRTSLESLIASLRRDLKCPDMNVVIGRISDHMKDGDWQKVRTAQVQAATSDPHGAWVDTDDLNNKPRKDKTGTQDDLHLTAPGYKLLAQRLARQAAALVVGKKPSADGRPE